MATHEQRQRRMIAMEAARLIAEHGMSDYHAAKRKAAQHLGVHDPLPRNEEVEQALGDYQRLFQADTQPRHLKKLREAALRKMLQCHFDIPYTHSKQGRIHSVKRAATGCSRKPQSFI